MGTERGPPDGDADGDDGEDSSDDRADRIEWWIRRHQDGDPDAFDELIPLLADELRRLAHARLSKLDGNLSMHTTVLINEVYLKLKRASAVHVNGAEHLRALLATAVRQVVVDHLRSRSRTRAKLPRSEYDVEQILEHVRSNVRPELRDALIDLSAAIDRLAEVDADAARVAELRLFGGYPMKEIPAIVGRPMRTVERDWEYARARLRSWLG